MAIAKRLALTTAALALSAMSAKAADVIEPPVYEAPPEVVAVAAGGWYLRGDIGMSNTILHGGMYNVLFDDVDNLEFLDEGTFSSGVTYRAGIGYQFSQWLRADATVEFRGKTDFSALDRYEGVDDADDSTWDASNDYEARTRQWLLMANAYIDLGTYAGITPYIGGGIGAAQNSVYSFRDVNVQNGGTAYAEPHTQWNMAWALHAGMAMDINERLTMDLGYSYLHLGDAQSGDISTFDGTNNVNNPMIFNDLVSHDLKFGLRYKLH